MKNTNIKKNISRIYQHIEHNESFAVISAYRHNKEDNLIQHEALKDKVRLLGLGFTEIKGGYLESGNKVESKSLFIANITRKDAIMLGNEFSQQSILYKDKTGISEIETIEAKSDINALNTFDIPEDKYKFTNTLKIIKSFYSRLLNANNDTQTIYIKEIEPTGFNRIAYNSHIPLAELDLDEI
ncbi:MAG: hypothetical protein NTY74_14640 [Ignavibacteriae bacterium]|nr:hypothetical protein [Ignavibacteriota bacterium]